MNNLEMYVHRDAHTFALHYNPFSITNDVKFTMAPKKRPEDCQFKDKCEQVLGKSQHIIEDFI